MRVKGYFVGQVVGQPRIINPQAQGKKPFLTYRLSSPEGKYSTNLDCDQYGQDLDAMAEEIQEGAWLTVSGDISANAFMGKKDPTKPMASLKMFVRERQILFSAPAQDPGPATQPASNQQTTNTRPAQGRSSSPAASAGRGHLENNEDY